MYFNGRNDEYLAIQTINEHNCGDLKEKQLDVLRLLWFTTDNNRLVIDDKPYVFNTNEIVCLTQFHNLSFSHINTVNLLRFNRQFYCILDHDSEVGCKGILYYGAAQLPIIRAENDEAKTLHAVWQMALQEIDERDNLQLEMLQMMLKRILILCMRIYKKQHEPSHFDEQQHSLIREYNYLIEQHFKTKHTVLEYADLLHKSPKTITNTFKKLGAKSPLKYIQERIILEAQRLLRYSNHDISTIGYDLGFTDIQTFSRFFKKQTGHTPTEYKSNP